ncbi:hypothetical protein BJ875DRAFT_457037 [Amylocarpus encephaloides]|uniref:Uncharacterized protein n=1 Tax=Amylocarpus encephaloides TaxID=45428 RepID=A0A9P7YNA5_9HELO|nr:hypothetical protein BJ875DRAFT_457037 [Amylocarpus encephaloides]
MDFSIIDAPELSNSTSKASDAPSSAAGNSIETTRQPEASETSRNYIDESTQISFSYNLTVDTGMKSAPGKPLNLLFSNDENRKKPTSLTRLDGQYEAINSYGLHDSMADGQVGSKEHISLKGKKKTGSPLLDLPLEVRYTQEQTKATIELRLKIKREMVYRYVIVAKRFTFGTYRESLFDDPPGRSLISFSLSILRTCKQACQEATPIFYRENTTIILIGKTRTGPSLPYPFDSSGTDYRGEQNESWGCTGRIHKEQFHRFNNVVFNIELSLDLVSDTREAFTRTLRMQHCIGGVTQSITARYKRMYFTAQRNTINHNWRINLIGRNQLPAALSSRGNGPQPTPVIIRQPSLRVFKLIILPLLQPPVLFAIEDGVVLIEQNGPYPEGLADLISRFTGYARSSRTDVVKPGFLINGQRSELIPLAIPSVSLRGWFEEWLLRAGWGDPEGSNWMENWQRIGIETLNKNTK